MADISKIQLKGTNDEEVVYNIKDETARNEIIYFLNNIVEEKLVEYIEKKFNDIMLSSMYDEETETLILYLQKN